VLPLVSGDLRELGLAEPVGTGASGPVVDSTVQKGLKAAAAAYQAAGDVFSDTMLRIYRATKQRLRTGLAGVADLCRIAVRSLECGGRTSNKRPLRGSSIERVTSIMAGG